VIVVDASVLVAHLEENDVHHAHARQVLIDCAEHELRISPITLAEILVGPARADRLEEAHTALRTLGVRQVAFRRKAPDRLATLRAETGLKLPDCCVLLAAQDCSAAGIASFDDRLAAAARTLGFEVLPSG
jgi:predicted nucleic acid-binding protein